MRECENECNRMYECKIVCKCEYDTSKTLVNINKTFLFTIFTYDQIGITNISSSSVTSSVWQRAATSVSKITNVLILVYTYSFI